MCVTIRSFVYCTYRPKIWSSRYFINTENVLCIVKDAAKYYDSTPLQMSEMYCDWFLSKTNFFSKHFWSCFMHDPYQSGPVWPRSALKTLVKPPSSPERDLHHPHPPQSVWCWRTSGVRMMHTRVMPFDGLTGWTFPALIQSTV